MTKKIEFFYDYGSPNCYLAWTQLPGLCTRYGAGLVYKPILLGGIFKAVGNETPVNVEPKGKWMFEDIVRYAKHYDVAFEMNPHFIFNSLSAMRGAVWAQSEGCIESYNRAMFEAAWVNGRNLGDADELRNIVSDVGLDATAFAGAIQSTEVKQALIDETNISVDKGVFGAPTMFVDGVMHFGQDRLPWIERALSDG
ncbi:MAG: 2-hydroxychromene-2-carboxylate isomerase [Arenicellales bacterium]|nr:2-hydroxychromene-2-carboxylate isomerase [Arenicellales bacterium]